MSLFQKILSQIKEKIDQESDRREDISKIIKAETTLSIDAAQLTIKKGTLFIAAAPTVKMALFIKREKLLKIFREKNIQIYTIV